MKNRGNGFSLDKYIAEVKAFIKRKETGKGTRVLKTGNIIYFPNTEEGRQKWVEPRQSFEEEFRKSGIPLKNA